MITTSSIEANILAYLQDHVEAIGSVQGDTDLLQTGLLDSLLVMDLVAHVEACYRVRLKHTDVTPENFRTAKCLAALIASELVRGQQAA